MYVLHSRAFFIWQTFLLGLLVQARYYILRFFRVVYFDAETDDSDLRTRYFTLRILWTIFFQVVCLYRCLLLVGYYIPQLRYRCQWPMAQMTQSHELPIRHPQLLKSIGTKRTGDLTVCATTPLPGPRAVAAVTPPCQMVGLSYG